MNMNYGNPDLHMHSLFSDGTDGLPELLGAVKASGVDVFSLTDHDTTAGCSAMLGLLDAGSPAFIPGVELSCRDQYGKYHILGYQYDVSSDVIRATVNFTHQLRMTKMMNRFHYLEDAYHFSFSKSDYMQMEKHNNPGRPHFAKMLVEKGYVPTREEAFEILGRYYGREPALAPEEAIYAIRLAGGIPVLAHGLLGNGSQRLTPSEMGDRVERLAAMGLMGLECYYSSFTVEQIKLMLAFAECNHLLVTAGSDYHGKTKNVLLGETRHPDMNRMKGFFRAVRERAGLAG